MTRPVWHRIQSAVILATLVTGCMPSFAAHPAIAPQHAFDPTVFFAGRTHGEGTLDVRIGTDRTLQVAGVGTLEADGRFRLDQTITFGDGAVETRVWYLTRVSQSRYTATLSDARGEVQAESNGSLFHLRYLLRHPAVYMEQWLYLNADGQSVDNFAQVTVLGVPWARLSERITRSDAVAK